MKMIVEHKDICKIQIDDFKIGDSSWAQELCDFEVNIDDFTQNDDITIKISGTCTYYCAGDSDATWNFKGTLTMSEDDFMQEYAYAAADGDSYVTFNGDIKASPTSGAHLIFDDNYLDDNLENTMERIRVKLSEELSYYDDTLENIVRFIITNAKNKVIEEIKRIDDVDLDKNDYIDYIYNNVFPPFWKSKNKKYEPIEKILNAQVAKDLKNGKITEFVNKELDECRESCEEKYDITADVYFSRLNKQ